MNDKCNCDKCMKKNDKCHPDYDICYYHCKPQKSDRDCDCLINKTEGLIEAINCKSDKVTDNLNTAQDAFALVDLASLNTVVTEVDNLLKQIDSNLQSIISELQKIDIPDLTDAINLLNTAIPAQNEGTEAVNTALTNGQIIAQLAEKLQCAFGATVQCLDKKENSKPMILVPYEESNHCEYKPNNCGCKTNHGECKHKTWYDDID